jgi:hypothetical protein
MRRRKLTSPSPLGLPKIICEGGCCKPETGRVGGPPLVEGCGIGAGECAGEVILGLFAGIGIGDEPAGCGVLWALAGESNPKRIPDFAPPTGPPFALYVLGPFALMVTDGFRLWSPPLREPPWTTAGAVTVGTAGGIADRPFTGETDDGLAC